MAAGRCSGCGRTDSLRKINLHVVDCQKYLTLFQNEPGRALDPAAEFQRFRTQDDTPEARAGQRGERMQVRFAQINQQQASSAARWARPPNLLD